MAIYQLRVLKVPMNGEMQKVNVLLYIWPQNQRKKNKDGNDDVFLSLFCLVLCFCLKVSIVYSYLCKSFSAERLTHREPTDLPALKPSIQDQVAMNTSNLINCRAHFINYPPDSTLLTDFFIKTSPLMNESVPSVSQSESSSHFSLSSFPKQPICPRHVSKLPSSPKTSEVSSGKRSTI